MDHDRSNAAANEKSRDKRGSNAGSMRLDRIFNLRMLDAGKIDPRFLGILMPENEVGVVPKGVTAQFTDDASIYHEKYFSTDYSDWLLTNTFRRINPIGQKPLILDIGSGSGSTVVSLLRMFARCHIIATDVSAELLSLLNAALRQTGHKANVTTVCMDLNRSRFQPEQFDLAVGKAILHHLFEPAVLIREVFAAIRPGGSLVFYEPFEPGNAMLALVLRQILDKSETNDGLESDIAEYLSHRIQVMQVMRCEEKDRRKYADIDDKWMFTRSYFERVAKEIGAEGLTIYSTSRPDTPFFEAIITWFRIALERDRSAMPQWAWDIVDDAEKGLSADCREDMLLTGCIIFTKSSADRRATEPQILRGKHTRS